MAASDTLIRSSDREVEALAPKQARLIRSAYKVMGEKGLRHLSAGRGGRGRGQQGHPPYYFESKEPDPPHHALGARPSPDASARRSPRRVRGGEGLGDDRRHLREPWSQTAGSTSSSSTSWATRPATTASPTWARRFTRSATASTPRSSKLGQEVFPRSDAREGATVVRALVDGLFTQWIQEKDWEKSHAEYRELQALRADLPDRQCLEAARLAVLSASFFSARSPSARRRASRTASIRSSCPCRFLKFVASYLVEDRDGWTVIDPGFDYPPARETWEEAPQRLAWTWSAT